MSLLHDVSASFYSAAGLANPEALFQAAIFEGEFLDAR